jgi:hypothetical protein
VTIFPTGVPMANAITAGADGNLWVPQGPPNGVNRVTPSGTVSFFNAGLNPGANITDGTNIVSGPDGNLWFLDEGSPYAIVRADVQLPPTVTTGAATNVTASSAEIDGSANGRGAASTVTIQYETTPALGSTAAAGSEPADDTAGAVSATVTGLPAGTTIYYRLAASNAYGTVSGGTLSFTTRPLDRDQDDQDDVHRLLTGNSARRAEPATHRSSGSVATCHIWVADARPAVQPGNGSLTGPDLRSAPIASLRPGFGPPGMLPRAIARRRLETAWRA